MDIKKLSKVVDSSEDDGWYIRGLNDFFEHYGELENCVYELKNCVRGGYTGVKTVDALKEYMTGILSELIEDVDWFRE